MHYITARPGNNYAGCRKHRVVAIIAALSRSDRRTHAITDWYRDWRRGTGWIQWKVIIINIIVIVKITRWKTIFLAVGKYT